MADITIDVSNGLISNVTDVLAPKASPTFTGVVYLAEDAYVVFEGTNVSDTHGHYETTLNVVDPTADRTISLPNVNGTVITTGNLTDIGVTYLTPALAASTYQPLDGDLTALAALSGTGILKRTGTNTYTLDSETYITASSPTFTGTVTLPSDTSIGSVSATELSYLNGVGSSIQDQINSKMTSVSGVSATEIGYLDGVTSSIQSQIDAKENADNIVSGTISVDLTDGVGTGTITGVDSAMNVVATLQAASQPTYLYSIAITGSGTTRTVFVRSSGTTNDDSDVTIAYIAHK